MIYIMGTCILSPQVWTQHEEYMAVHAMSFDLMTQIISVKRVHAEKQLECTED